MKSIQKEKLQSIFNGLETANEKFVQHYPGDGERQQPVHTLYGGAQLYKAGATKKIGELALKAFNTYAADANTLAKALNLPGDKALWQQVHKRVIAKLGLCAVEDFRIDFEDGYGNRPDAEEDACAEFTAKEFASALSQGIAAPYMGIRIKPFNAELKTRSARTLDIFVTTLIKENNGKVPENFTITLPKVNIPEQVTAFVQLLDHLEEQLGLENGALEIEIMIETTQALLSQNGVSHMPLIYKAANGRCRGAHN